MNPQFSIIIPTFNRANFIYKAIYSVLEQEYSDFEIIVVDDGSTDNTEKVVKSIQDKRVRYINKINEERAIARNTGCKMALGNYVTFLDSDDLLYSNHLFVANKIIKGNENIVIFHLGYDVKNSEGEIIKTVNDLNALINSQLIVGNPLSCNGVFIERRIALQNLFNSNRKMSALEDWELWMRLAPHYPIYCFNEITSAIINHNSRSVVQTKKDELILRFETLFEVILNNIEITNYYKTELYKFKASCYTYIALHLALTKKNRTTTIKYLLKGIITNVSVISTKRFYAILKHFF